MRSIQKTTLEYWALIAEITGAIAVVLSVIYLGLQIRANTKVLRSQAHYNAFCWAAPMAARCRTNNGVELTAVRAPEVYVMTNFCSVFPRRKLSRPSRRR